MAAEPPQYFSLYLTRRKYFILTNASGHSEPHICDLQSWRFILPKKKKKKSTSQPLSLNKAPLKSPSLGMKLQILEKPLLGRNATTYLLSKKSHPGAQCKISALIIKALQRRDSGYLKGCLFFHDHGFPNSCISKEPWHCQPVGGGCETHSCKRKINFRFYWGQC